MTNLKFLGKHPIGIELFESSTLQSATAFSQLFPYSVLSITLSDRGLFTARGHTFKEHVHTRTHKCNTPYYSLLICWALIETPLSLSHTCNSSLIISEGAFGGGEKGGWWKERTPESPVTGHLCIHSSGWIKLPTATQCLLPLSTVVLGILLVPSHSGVTHTKLTQHMCMQADQDPKDSLNYVIRSIIYIHQQQFF